MRVLLFVLWIFGVSAAWAEPLALSHYVGNFLSVDIEIGGQRAHLLFDTGAGVTSITPAFARRIGCMPHGSLTGFRVSGERVSFQKCEGIPIAVSARRAVRDVAVLDLASILPADWPPIDGVMGLDVFDGGEMTLHLANREIDLGHRQGGGWREGEMRVQREMGGMGVSAFVRAQASNGSLWMLLDSGNMGPTLLSPGALSQLRSTAPPSALSVSGVGSHQVDATALATAIYDGNLSSAFIRNFEVAIDLRHNRIWWRPAQRAQH